jgi:hypothetical protein
MDGLALVVGIKYIVHHAHRIVYIDTHASISGPLPSSEPLSSLPPKMHVQIFFVRSD